MAFCSILCSCLTRGQIFAGICGYLNITLTNMIYHSPVGRSTCTIMVEIRLAISFNFLIITFVFALNPQDSWLALYARQCTVNNSVVISFNCMHTQSGHKQTSSELSKYTPGDPSSTMNTTWGHVQPRTIY